MPGSMKDVSQLLAAEVLNEIGVNADSATALSTLFNYVSHGSVADGTATERLDNVYSALSVVMGRQFIAVRPYAAKLDLIDALDTEMYTNRLRKISFATKLPLASGMFNTDLYTNLAEGYDNGSNSGESTASMWEQHRAVPIELDFSGSSVWQDALTRDLDAIKQAFRNEAEFTQFWTGVVTEKANDIELQKEAFRRLNLCSAIASRYALAGSEDYDAPGKETVAINLTKGFNDKFGTSYTSEELRSTYLKDFLAYFVATFKAVSDRMTIKSCFYHLAISKEVNSVDYYVLRHTPKDRQRAFLYSPLFRDAESLVMPEIFHDDYLDRPNGELVEFWQTFTGDSETGAEITATTKILDTDEAGTEVDIPYVVAFLFDRDALVTDFQLERAMNTPVEARKGYVNTWWSFAKNNINDITESGVVFYMQDPTDAGEGGAEGGAEGGEGGAEGGEGGQE